MMRAGWVGRVAVLAAALPLSGCATMFGGYDLAANGLTREEDELRRAVAFEPDVAYAEVIEGKQSLPDDDLLRLLYAGTAGRYAGVWDESSRLLDLASYLAEDRVTYSLSREALSMITSDRALAYTPGPTERLMIHYIAALNYLDARDLDGAAVEARRIEALLDQLGDSRAGPVSPVAAAEGGGPIHRSGVSASDRFLHYFAGSVLEAAGDSNAADVAFRRSGAFADSWGEGPWGSGPAAAGDSLGDLVVLVERGFVPHRVEQSVVIVLPTAQVKALTEGSAGEKALAATAAAARILVTAAAVYGDRSGYYHDTGYRTPLHLEPWRGDECDHRSGPPSASGGERICPEEGTDSKPYLLRISWPVLFEEPGVRNPLRVRAGDLGQEAVARLDVGDAVRADFEAERATVLARTIARAAAKLALSASVEAQVSKRDEGAGQLLGILTNLGTLLTERADTRGWHLLPGSISMVRLRLPPGSHDLSLEVDRPGAAGSARTLDLGTVDVRRGETTFLSTRLWR